MRKISKVPNKKVFIPEEDEEEKYRKTESKKAIIRADFEKHKKELILNVSDASKMNEIRVYSPLILHLSPFIAKKSTGRTINL